MECSSLNDKNNELMDAICQVKIELANYKEENEDQDLKLLMLNS